MCYFIPFLHQHEPEDVICRESYHYHSAMANKSLDAFVRLMRG